ncbi:MAG: hypothetical protein FVQ83_01890 [Chloroflexi bacterium]|nr:hypothetical protein [Chloroflexota bacterium]
MQKTNLIFRIVILLFIAMLLSACGGDGPVILTSPQPEVSVDTPEPETPQETSEPPALPDPVDTISADIHLDPAVVSMDDEDSLLICRFIYEGLVGLDGDGNLVPTLALSWTVSDDELDYIFYLRPDAVFHDGTQLDADLVAANFNRWFDPDHSLHGDSSFEAWETYMLGFKDETNDDGSPVSVFDGIEKVNDLTVLVHLNRPVPQFLEYLAHPAFSILNPTALAADGDAYGTASGSSVGTGPYSVADWTNEALTLSSNSNYWGTPPGEGLEFPFE